MSTRPTETPLSPLATGSFRRKSAGVSLVAVLTIGAYYFANLPGPVAGGTGVPPGATSLALTALTLIVTVEVALQVALVVGAGGVEAISERDRHAAATARRYAYPVLVAGALATFGAAHLGAPPFRLAHLALASLLLAETSRLACQLLWRPRTAR